MDETQFRARIAQIHGDLDAYSYYDLLNLQPSATVDDIRNAFHRMALSMHPDRHRLVSDASLKQQVYAIYKRICEGYQVLTQPKSRQEYHESLARGERRLVRKTRQSSGPKRVEEEIGNLQARKFFRMGQDAARRGDGKNARLNYRFALDLESHPIIQQRLDALEAKEPGTK